MQPQFFKRHTPFCPVRRPFCSSISSHQQQKQATRGKRGGSALHLALLLSLGRRHSLRPFVIVEQLPNSSENSFLCSLFASSRWGLLGGGVSGRSTIWAEGNKYRLRYPSQCSQFPACPGFSDAGPPALDPIGRVPCLGRPSDPCVNNGEQTHHKRETCACCVH